MSARKNARDLQRVPEAIRSYMADQAKTYALLAFRNGPLENLHAGRVCEHCSGDTTVSHITTAEMKVLMKFAVDRIYELLALRLIDLDEFDKKMRYALEFTKNWDEPECGL